MTTTENNREFYDRLGAFHEKLVEDLAPDLIENPRLADALTEEIESKRIQTEEANIKAKGPQDGGIAELIGLGSQAATDIGSTYLPQGVEDYDDDVSSQRLLALADLYYLYQHEKVGVFRAVKKLKQLFYAGRIRLSSGQGAYGLYRFDKRQVLRYTKQQRLQTYRRAFGYLNVPLMPGAKPNKQFHGLFTQFVNSVAQYWRDKRISDVIRERPYDPSFGSVAVVRRAGLDLRNNLKWPSYGHINVFRIEVLQLLKEAFQILGADDVRNLFGSENAWEALEDVMRRYFNEDIQASQRHRMAVTGRNLLRWLANKYILKTSQAQFEALLQDIANDSEEWITSAESLGIAYRSNLKGAIPLEYRRDGGRRMRRVEQG